MPITEIQAAWGLVSKMAEKGAFADRSVKPGPYLKQTWWSSAWIPIVTNDMGDYFCLDTDPPDPKRVGQVLLFFQNHPERPLIAGSLKAWFERISKDFESGLYHYDHQKGFDGEAFLWSALEGKHLLDDTEGILIVEE
jgi:cell wall assembly regulator SMI1